MYVRKLFYKKIIKNSVNQQFNKYFKSKAYLQVFFYDYCIHIHWKILIFCPHIKFSQLFFQDMDFPMTSTISSSLLSQKISISYRYIYSIMLPYCDFFLLTPQLFVCFKNIKRSVIRNRLWKHGLDTPYSYCWGKNLREQKTTEV